MKHFILRVLRLIFGVFLFAIGIVFVLEADIGYSPWEVFHVGLSKTTGLSIGSLSILTGAAVLVAVTIAGEKFGLGTIIGIIMTGVFIDLILSLDIIPRAINLPAGLIMLVAGLFILSFGTYFYMGSAFGAGPRDNLMVVLARKTKFPIGVCRGAVELAVTAAGWLFGGMVGIGTVISVVGIGACVQTVFKLFKFDATAIKHENLAETIVFLTGGKKR